MSPLLRHVTSAVLVMAGVLATSACSDDKNTTSSSTSAVCVAPPAKNAYCSTCAVAANASPASCKGSRNVDACCAFVAAPTQELARGTGLNRYSSNDPAVKLGCLDDPGTVGTPKTVTLKGWVRLFSGGGDSAGVKVEIFEEGPNGALGKPVGTAVVTTDADTPEPKRETFLKKCPDGGCIFRAFEYKGVPTETPLVVRTSDATGGQQWADFYDYNVYFANTKVEAGDVVTYEPSAVAATDINTVASAAGGFTVKQDRGLLAGEVHDCDDVRVAGAMVDTDAAHEGDMFYFGENESDPLPDKSRALLGTSKLGLFGTLNLPTGTPIRVSALGKVGGQTVLLGHYTVQTFPGAVTALSFRGRRPWQK